MSAVKKTVKIVLFLFSALVLLVIGGGIYLYMNINSITKDYSERAASDALGVPVTIGEMDILLEDMKVVVRDVAVANPEGYRNAHAITIKNIMLDGESFSPQHLTFSSVDVDGTDVFLEVSQNGLNLGALQKATAQELQDGEGEAQTADSTAAKVIVRRFSLTGAKLTPSVTHLPSRDFSAVEVPDIRLSDIGEKENGVVAEEAIAQIMNVVIKEVAKTANREGFLKGLPFEYVNKMGVSFGEVFQKNLKESYKKEVNKFKEGFDSIKGMFE
ncbi:MAG: hypothetical protein ACLFP8_05400 [Alphaproteobacteria bacterium]